jgi:Bacterial SH3 domain
MIQAQALENELIRQHGNASGHDDPVRAHKAFGGSARRHGSNASSDVMQNRRRIKVDTAPCVANHRWRALTQRLSVPIAGLIVTAAVGSVIFFLQASMRQPHVVAAVDEPSKEKSPVVGAARATKELVLRVEEPGGPEKAGVEEERAIERGIEPGNTVAAHSDDPRVAPPVTTQPNENLASDAEKLDVARTINHVNMRAGPSNDQAVVMTIPAGSRVQVVKCRHWCEVIFAGQQGWVYKGFIDTSPMPRRP